MAEDRDPEKLFDPEKLRLEAGQLVYDVWDAAIGGVSEREKVRLRRVAYNLAARLLVAGRRAGKPKLEEMEQCIRECMARGDDARTMAGMLLNLYEYTDGRPRLPVTPAEREARWAVSVRFAIEAASEAEARAVVDRVLASLRRELPLQGDPAIAPPGFRDGIWVATLQPDLTVLPGIEPDDAPNRCRYVSNHFGAGLTWMSCDTRHGARWDWPPDIFSRQPGQDDVLLHPAVQAVRILCETRQA